MNIAVPLLPIGLSLALAAALAGAVKPQTQANALASASASASAAPSASRASPPVVDLHVDLAFDIQAHARRIGDARAETSLARLRQGNVQTLVLPLYVHDAWKKPPEEVRRAYETTWNGLRSAITSREARGTFLMPPEPMDGQHIATVLSFEGADGFSSNPNLIVPWIEKGACLVGLVHFRTNALAGSSTEPARDKRKVGLTDAGRLLVRTVYSHGALVDVAHASDAAADEIAAIAKDFGAPLVDSHTGMRALVPIERNVDDTRARAIAESGGVLGIDIHSGHIGAQRGMPATLDDVVAHLTHAVQVAGIEHVAIGSDLDGGIEPPQGSNGAATWPLIAQKLRVQGWQQRDIEAVFGANALRVLGWARQKGCGRVLQ